MNAPRLRRPRARRLIVPLVVGITACASAIAIGSGRQDRAGVPARWPDAAHISRASAAAYASPDQSGQSQQGDSGGGQGGGGQGGGSQGGGGDQGGGGQGSGAQGSG